MKQCSRTPFRANFSPQPLMILVFWLAGWLAKRW